MKHLLVAGLTAGLMVAATTASAKTATICGQKLDYTVQQPTTDVPAALRAFSGVWVGDAGAVVEVYDGTFCVGLVVESVRADGSVTAKYVWGDKVKLQVGTNFDIKPGVVDWSGRIVNNALILDTPNRAYSYELRVAGNELKGKRSAPDGKNVITLKRS